MRRWPFISACLLFVFLPGLAPAESSPPMVGGQLPEMVLDIPKSSVDQEYLGLSADGTFKIADIKARLVIIEIFSMY